MTSDDGGTRPIRVGSWPGVSENTVIATLIGALEDEGLSVVAVEDPTCVAPGTLDILHIHWPEQIFWRSGGVATKALRVLTTLNALRRLRATGVKIVWMVHNLRPHDASAKQMALWNVYVAGLKALTNAYVTLSVRTESVVAQGLKLPPSAVVTSVRHPAYAPGPTQAEARRRLAIPAGARVWGYFGAIRPYKGVEELIEVFAQVDDPTARLIIAGAPHSSAMTETLQAAAARDPRIELHLGYLDEARLSDAIAAADAIVLPFKDYLHSGSTVRALSQGKLTITPETPFSLGLRDDLGPAYVRLYQKPLTPERLAMIATPTEPIDMSAYAPRQTAKALARLYRRVL